MLDLWKGSIGVLLLCIFAVCVCCVPPLSKLSPLQIIQQLLDFAELLRRRGRGGGGVITPRVANNNALHENFFENYVVFLWFCCTYCFNFEMLWNPSEKKWVSRLLSCQSLHYVFDGFDFHATLKLFCTYCTQYNIFTFSR